MEVDPVILEIRAEMGRYRAELKSTTALAQQSFDRQEKSVVSLERQLARSTGNMQRMLSGARSAFVGAFAGVSFVALAQQVLGYVDAFKQYEAQLKLATAQTGSFAQAQADVERIAAETRTGIAETASLYATFQRNARELGITQEQAARATETVSKAFAISGATAAEAAGGLRQFLQGIQSGTLRGEELNSVLENAPRLARLIADSLGITIGQLRAMGQEGQLAGDKLIAALTDRKFTASIDEEFKQLPVTFDQAMTQVANAATLTFGAFDRGGEFSAALASFITGGTSGMADLATAAEQAGVDIRAAFGALGDVFEPLWDGAKDVFDRLDIRIQSTRDSIGQLFGLYDQVNNLFIGVDRWATGVDNALKRGGVMMGREKPLPEWSNTRSGWERNFDRRQGQQQDRVQARKVLDWLQNWSGQSDAPPAKPSAPAATKKKGRAGPSAETLAKRAETERIRDLRDDQAFADEKAQLDQDLLRARAASVTAADTLATFERQEIEFARSRQNAAYQADVGMKRLTQAQADELIAKNDAVAAERQRALDVREARRVADEALDLQLSDLRTQQDILSEQIGLADTADERRRLELALLDLQRKEEEARLRAIIAVNSGASAAEQKAAQARLDALPGIYDARREGVERQNESPGSSYLRSLQVDAKNAADALEEVNVRGLEGLEDGLVDVISGVRSLGDAFSDVAKQIIADLARIAIRKSIIEPVANALFGNSGGGDWASGVGDSASHLGIASGDGANGLDKFLRGIFGRASGGYMAPNSVRRVNEGRGNVELLRMGPQGGTVIPLGQTQAAPPVAAPVQPAIVQIVVDEGAAFVPRVQAISGEVSVQVVRQAAPQIADAATAQTVSALGRPRL